MKKLEDHPEIVKAMRTGMPNAWTAKKCPVCGEEWNEIVYRDIDGEIVGCENCIKVEYLYK